MKTLANCNAREFMRQTLKLRKPFAEWLENTGIAEIRRRRPEGFDEMDVDAQTKALSEQGRRNLRDMLFTAFEKDEAGTLNVLALCCFIEPEQIDEYSIAECFGAVIEMLNNEVVRDFFMLFMS